MRVFKWANDLAIPLPAEVVKALDLREGDDLTLSIIGKATVAIEKTHERQELLARLRKYRGRLPTDFRFDRLEANRRATPHFSPSPVN